MNNLERRPVYGMTGEIGKDGLLNPEQQLILDTIQEQAVASCETYLDSRQPDDPFPMVAMATGIGKGKIIHKVIERQFRKKPDSRVLLIAGTKVILVNQSHEALNDYQEAENIDEVTSDTSSYDSQTSLPTSILYRLGKYGDNSANVQIATIQTLQSEYRNIRIDPSLWDLLIVDEVHNIGTSLRQQVIKQFHNVVGFTATPLRHSGQMKEPEDYGFSIVESLTLTEAQALRLLPPLCGMQIDTKEIVDQIPTKLNGMIDYKKLETLLKRNPNLRPFIAERVANIISVGDKTYKTVVVVNFVWEARELAELFRERGIRAGVAVNNKAAREIHSEEIPALDSIERYGLPSSDSRGLDVLISPYVASEGFDAPYTEVLVWASPTDSPLRYTQYTGRLARRAEGKLFGVVIDCLYQTNQYNWSYNFGMWMKGEVRQLDNGLLWLGPETDIHTLNQLPSVQMLSMHTNSKLINDLQQEQILDLQEGDFPITVNTLSDYFVGSTKKLISLAHSVMLQMESEKKGSIQIRKHTTQAIPVATDKSRFIEFMRQAGAVFIDPSTEEIKEGEIPIIGKDLSRYFVGHWKRTVSTARSIVKVLQENEPNLIVLRKRNNRIVTVVTDTRRLIKEMQRRGVALRSVDDELVEIYKDDMGGFPINQSELAKTFIGSYPSNYKKAQEVIQEMENEYMGATFKARRGGEIVTFVKDREQFIQLMISKGAKLREIKTNDTVVDNDFILIRNSYELFVGKFRGTSKYVSSVIKELEEQYPDKFKIRKFRGRTVKVFDNRHLFIQKMTEKGAVLKSDFSTELSEDDLVISLSELNKIFSGGNERLSKLREKALSLIYESNPKLIVRKRRATSYRMVVKDRELFIRTMIEVGARLKKQE